MCKMLNRFDFLLIMITAAFSEKALFSFLNAHKKIKHNRTYKTIFIS